jgi:type IV pilus assembly protein PilC
MRHNRQLLNFSLTLHDCLSAGIHLEAALNCILQQSSDPHLRIALNTLLQRIRDGLTLTSAMERTPFFPAEFVAQLSVGEESGNLDTMLGNISHTLEEKLTNLTTHLSQLLEPAIMVILGTMMGFIIISLYLPLFRLGDLF